MSKTKRGKRDGTGPYKGSLQSRTNKIGKRMEKGEPCLKFPKKTKNAKKKKK